MHLPPALNKQITIVSDLHVDVYRDQKHTEKFAKELRAQNKESDILIVAGDMCEVHYAEYAAKVLCDTFNKVIHVSGNHENWGSTIELAEEKFDEIGSKIDNFIHLNNERATIDGISFIGTTLWSDLTISKFLRNLAQGWPDFSRTFDFTFDDYIELHHTAIRFLRENYEQDDIIITHHMPLYELIHEKYKGHQANAFFASDLTRLIKTLNPKIWIYGHTHTYTEEKMHGCKFICNPFGYPNENTLFQYKCSFVTDSEYIEKEEVEEENYV